MSQSKVANLLSNRDDGRSWIDQKRTCVCNAKKNDKNFHPKFKRNQKRRAQVMPEVDYALPAIPRIRSSKFVARHFANSSGVDLTNAHFRAIV